MKEKYIEPQNIDSLKAELLKFQKDTSVLSVLFFMADEESYDVELVTPLLKNFSKPIIGGVFPGLIFKGEQRNKGVLLIPLDFQLNTQLIDLGDSCEKIINKLLPYQNETNNFLDASCLFVFADALSQNKDLLIDCLFNFFGIHPTYIGGGAGSLNFKPMKCIINNDGFHENAAVVGLGNKKVAIGVSHGWESISDPLKVTKSNKNEVESINWRPAFEAYKEIVEKHSEKQFAATNFFEIAKSYPLGISKMDSEKVIRDPFKTSNNTLHFIDVINEGSYVEIMHGNINLLLLGAKNAKETAVSQFEGNLAESNILCVDCISRVLFMEKDLEKELKIINENSNAFGIFSIGEIASSDTILEIYNKTIVVTVW